MTFAQYRDQNDNDFDPIVFHDGRGDFDSELLSESLDNFALSMTPIDDL